MDPNDEKKTPPAPPPPVKGERITTPAVTDWKLQNTDKFQLRAKTSEEEALFDAVAARHVEKPSGVLYSIAQLIKGALGAGVLSGHVAYMSGGVAVSVVAHVFLGVYMAYCFYLLYASAQILYQRTRIPKLNYSDLGEAAAICTNHPKIMRWSRCFRKFIDVIICIDLFGSCVAYQLIFCGSLKQLIEGTQQSSIAPLKDGYPSLRIYTLIFMIPFIIITLIRHLEYLAPFSMVANLVVILCIIMTIYYSFQENPNFKDLTLATDFMGFLKFVGMSVFSMSCSGVVLAVENNMSKPKKFPLALFVGMGFNIAATLLTSFFGYVAYREKSAAPITLNFPMDSIAPKILKGAMCFMIYVTHALNFWVPFNNVFYYVKLSYNEKNHLWMEYTLRAAICVVITILGVAFPKISSILAILGTFCLSLMSFIWPNLIYAMVIYYRPGFGRFRWRLVLASVLMLIGFFVWTAGTVCNIYDLINEFGSDKT